MEAKYCKNKRKYTNKCNCEDTAKCPDYWKQGIGSLESNGISNVSSSINVRNSSNSRG